MFKWALVFFVISLIAGLFGFTDVAVASAGIAKFLFFVFFGLCMVFLIAALIVGNKVRDYFRGRHV
ncbi:MAG: DUF1328 domain-containing protein [Candidatus Omnitrophota bacterium]|nr:DUF1328 domain-containing protein [Candidatus Omnitrophota bacterium]